MYLSEMTHKKYKMPEDLLKEFEELEKEVRKEIKEI